MARSFKRKEPLAAMTSIDMTPLIDLSFSLLIIFMISTPLLEQTIPIDLPTESQKPQPQDEKPEVRVVNIKAGGQIFLGQTPVTFETLKSELATLAKSNPETVLAIRADGSLNYQSVIDVLDVARLNGLSKLHLDTKAGERP